MADPWQPIETAPKPPLDSPYTAVCFIAWCPEKDAPSGGDFRIVWWEPRMHGTVGGWTNDADFEVFPTLWMSIPPLPRMPEQWEEEEKRSSPKMAVECKYCQAKEPCFNGKTMAGFICQYPEAMTSEEKRPSPERFAITGSVEDCVAESNAGSVAVIPPPTPTDAVLNLAWLYENRAAARDYDAETAIRRCHAAEKSASALREILRPVLGTEPCPTCKDVEHNYPQEMQAKVFVNCKGCGGTGTHDIIDGLTDVGMVERLVADLAKLADAEDAMRDVAFTLGRRLQFADIRRGGFSQED